MGTAARIPNWQRIRREALDRDGSRCRDCGKAGRLEVHHLRALLDGVSNALENLLTLCVVCHLARHRRPTSPEKEAWALMVKELV